MPTGNFGLIRPADFNPQDSDIYYVYRADAYSEPTTPVKVATTNLTQQIDPDFPLIPLGGLYNLKLPTTQFNKTGLYDIYVKPKRFKTIIADCGVLAVDPTVRGLIIRLDDVALEHRSRFNTNNLVGYRIEYLENGLKVPNYFTIVTSNFRVEPISDTVSTINQKAVKYRLNENSSLVFCTVSPSTQFNLQPNVLPYIGSPTQEILVQNTFFDPKHIAIELVENDINTIADAVLGSQTKNIENGLRTYYDKNGNIIKQFTEYVVKDTTTGNTLYEVKKINQNVDFTESIKTV